MRYAAILLALVLFAGRGFAEDNTKTRAVEIKLPIFQTQLTSGMKFKEVKAALKSVSLDGEMVGDTGMYFAPIYSGNDSCILIISTEKDKLMSATFIVVDSSTSSMRDTLRNWFQQQLTALPSAEHLVDQDENGIPREAWATEQISWFRQVIHTPNGRRVISFSFIFRGKEFFEKTGSKKGIDLF
jgi:hypothetical protein